jgi:hypothetical protein
MSFARKFQRRNRVMPARSEEARKCPCCGTTMVLLDRGMKHRSDECFYGLHELCSGACFCWCHPKNEAQDAT